MHEKRKKIHINIRNIENKKGHGNRGLFHGQPTEESPWPRSDSTSLQKWQFFCQSHKQAPTLLVKAY